MPLHGKPDLVLDTSIGHLKVSTEAGRTYFEGLFSLSDNEGIALAATLIGTDIETLVAWLESDEPYHECECETA